SAGIYVVQIDELIENGTYNYKLLDYTHGFTTALTANSWCECDEDGTLYLCCTDCVRAVSTTEKAGDKADYNIIVNSLRYQDEVVEPDADGRFKIPAGDGRIVISAAVLNFSMSNPLVKLYLEGSSDDGTVSSQSDISDLEYTNLEPGGYTLHIQILDTITREVMREETFIITKDARFFELPVVKICIFLLSILATAFIVYRVIRMTIISRQYEEIRAAKEEAERANGAKSRFLANMSHEIRTPINTIMGMDQMILREDVPAGAGDYGKTVNSYAASIMNASKLLLSLVNDILDLSKVESGKMTLVETPYGTLPFFRSIVEMIRVKSDEKGLWFNLDIDPEIPSSLVGDEGKIKQILLNLLTNAVKYTPEGGFTLHVRVEAANANTRRIYYAVEDTGIGVRDEDRDKLFTAFERVDEKRNKAILGTGLGLDISRQFVELMGGRLTCDSVYGEGSTFHFTLNQVVEDDAPMGEFTMERVDSADDLAYKPLFSAPNARVLVVDDNEMNLRVLLGLLEKTCVRADTALSGQKCLDMVSEEGNYDIILLDHMMPQMDGIETLGRLREAGFEKPVIALTANYANEGEQYYRSEGFDGYLAKPVDGRALEECLMRNLPEELMEEPADGVPEVALSDGEAEAFAALGSVSGINVDDGVSFCGSKASFVAAAETFARTLQARMDELGDALSRGDYEFYTIKVHAMKSSAGSIGLNDISEMSRSLEDAGHSGDTGIIDRDDPALRRALESVLAQLDDIFGTQDEGAADLPPADSEMIEDAKGALRELAGMMDFDGTRMVLDSLKEFSLPPDEKELFDAVETALAALDWAKIEEIV
nr:response regulator [Eubacterium sp.]